MNTRSKLLVVASILYLMCFSTSCNKLARCNNPTDGPEPILFQKYFGNYKKGSVWIYRSKDGSKTDSVYFDTFEVTSIIEADPCQVLRSKLGYLKSRYLSRDSTDVRYSLTYLGGSKNAKGLLDVDANNSIGILSLLTNNLDLVFKSCEGNCDGIDSKYFPFFVQSYQQSNVLDGLMLDSLWQQTHIIIAPKYGIIQFVSPLTNDTFFLQKTNF